MQAELDMEELIWDEAVFIAKDERQEKAEKVAIVEEMINSVLEDVLSTSKGPVHVGADEEMQRRKSLCWKKWRCPPPRTKSGWKQC